MLNFFQGQASARPHGPGSSPGRCGKRWTSRMEALLEVTAHSSAGVVLHEITWSLERNLCILPLARCCRLYYVDMFLWNRPKVPNLGMPRSLLKSRVQSEISREMASATSLMITAPYSCRMVRWRKSNEDANRRALTKSSACQSAETMLLHCKAWLKCIGRSLSFGRICGIVGMAFHGARGAWWISRSCFA